MCCNSNIRRGIYKKTRVGRSTISGWGLFLLEDANKRDFIMEYKGRMKLMMIMIIIMMMMMMMIIMIIMMTMIMMIIKMMVIMMIIMIMMMMIMIVVW